MGGWWSGWGGAISFDVKTGCIYNTTMSLMNVRLNDEQTAKAKWLREQGVEISQVMREALEAEYERRVLKRRTPGEIDAMFREIYEKYPDPEGLPPRGFDLRDRKAVREFIVGRLKSKKLRKP